MRSLLCSLMLAAMLVTGGASAQEAATPPAEEGYALQPAVGEYLKIDRKTGDVSLCAARAGVWSCQLLPDDRKAYEDRIAELEADNDRLGKRVADLESGTVTGRAPLFDENDQRRLDEFFSLSDRMFRHFFDMVDRLRERDNKPI